MEGNFPFMFLVKLQQGFVHGLYDLGEKTKLYVSSGAGFWGPSLRVFAPSEIVILNLKGKNEFFKRKFETFWFCSGD